MLWGSMTFSAHEVLSKRGILHRDISAGNILIRVNASVDETFSEIIQEEYPLDKTEGFLTDFEFASLPPSQAVTSNQQLPKDGLTARSRSLLAVDARADIRPTGDHYVHLDGFGRSPH